MNIFITLEQLSYGYYVIALLLFLAQYGTVNGNSNCNNEVGQSEVVPCGGQGSFVNLCGLCVGGTTGQTDTEGVDNCSVCGGDNSCIGCDGVKSSNKISDACGACLEPDASLRDNCTKITTVYPNVLDKAVDRIVTVRLRGAGLNPSNVPDVSCSLQPLDPQQQPVKIEKQSVEDGLIQLEVTLSDKLGTFAVHCSSNTIGPLESRNEVTLMIVDSKELCITDYNPKEFSVDKEFQMELTIPSVKDKSNVLCYVKKKSQQTAEVVQAVEVTAGRVKCGPYVAKRAAHMEWGVAYTWDGATDGEGCSPAAEFTVRAPPPVIQSAEFTDGLEEIHVKFDHNVDGSENCKDIFSPDTLQLLGKDANCSFVGNNLIVSLGKDPKLTGNSELKLLDNSHVYREQSDHSLTSPASGKVTLTPPEPKASNPQYEVVAPKMICPDDQQGTALGFNVPKTGFSSDSQPQVIRLSAHGGGQNLKYNWTVEFTAERKDQRHNLMVWRSVRMLQTYLTKSAQQGGPIALNTSMLMPGIEYKISVSGTNAIGIEGKKQQFSFKVMPKDKKNRTENETSHSQLVLKGPSTTWSKTDYYVEAEVDTCDIQVVRPIVTCEWKIVGELSQNIELPVGRRLRLQRGILQGGKQYNISSTCTSEARDSSQKTEMTAWLAVNVQSEGLRARISQQEVVLGTGQTLLLDASQSLDEDMKPGNLQFSWCCRQMAGGRCLLPQAGETVTLESAFKDAFQEQILRIPPGSLAVGRYVFSVEVTKAGSPPSKAQTIVEVVSGIPAIVTTTPGGQINYVNPNEGVTIPAVVMKTREGCRMWWSVQQEPGHEYFSLADVGLGDVVLVTSEEARDPMGREYTLVIPGPTGTWPGLKGNAVYELRLSVFCPQQGQLKSSVSHADFVITTNSPPLVKPLKVSPTAGEALRTKFLFSTEAANDAFSDYPLLYQYGYRINDQELTHFFSTSNEELQSSTTLPCVSGNQIVVLPLLTVCDVHKLCTTVTGSEVTVTLPNNLSLAEIQEIGDQFSEYIASQQYSEAQSYAEVTLQTLKQLPNQALYTAAVEVIESEIRKELKRKQDGLDGSFGSLQSSLDFLDMSISVMSDLPMSGSTLQDLAAFKDKILSLAKHNHEIRAKYTSFPNRQTKSPKLKSRKRRSNGDNNSNNGAELSTLMSETNIKSMILVSEAVFRSGNESRVLMEKEKLLKDLPNFMYHLCLRKDQQKTYIESSIVQFSVQRLLSSNTIMKTEYNVPDRSKGPPAINETGMVSLGKAVADKYGPSKTTCVGGVHFPGDYLMDVAVGKNISQSKHKLRASDVFEVKLANVGKTPGKLDHPLTLKLPVSTINIGEDKILNCATWHEGTWNTEDCETEESTIVNLQTYSVCKCNVLGYFTVIIDDVPTTTVATTTTTVTTTTVLPTTTSTDITTSAFTTVESTIQVTSTASTELMTLGSTIAARLEKDGECIDLPPGSIAEGVPLSNATYNVSFTIDGDFKTVVGERKKEFEQKIRCQIIARMKMPRKMIRAIEVAPGSIIVTVKLVDTDVKRAKTVIQDLAQAIQNGEIDFHDLQNNKLKVPKQTVTIVEPYRAEKSNTVIYAVVGCVLFSIISIVSLVAGAMIIKKRKDTEKLKKQQIPTIAKGVPTYRQFQFENSIEGTEASLARYRSNYPTMGTAGTLMMGTVMGIGGTQMITFANRAGLRYETQANGNQYLHPDMSYNVSQTSKKKKKKKQKHGVHRAGSRGGLLNSEESLVGDEDSGIVDGTNASEDRNIRNRNKDKKNSKGSVTEFDVLPGTPTDDM